MTVEPDLRQLGEWRTHVNIAPSRHHHQHPTIDTTFKTTYLQIEYRRRGQKKLELWDYQKVENVLRSV